MPLRLRPRKALPHLKFEVVAVLTYLADQADLSQAKIFFESRTFLTQIPTFLKSSRKLRYILTVCS